MYQAKVTVMVWLSKDQEKMREAEVLLLEEFDLSRAPLASHAIQRGAYEAFVTALAEVVKEEPKNDI